MTTDSRKGKARQKALPRSAAAPDRSETRLQNIATAAYFKAAARGFAPGGEMDDWISAEREYEAGQGAQP